MSRPAAICPAPGPSKPSPNMFGVQGRWWWVPIWGRVAHLYILPCLMSCKVKTCGNHQVNQRDRVGRNHAERNAE